MSGQFNSELTWNALDLSNGSRSQIEASAGTGKTWTISVLHLRLLLERKLSATQIVVATFTEAAAQELHERIRQRLLWAEQSAQNFLRDGTAPRGEDDARYLLQRWQSAADVCNGDQLRLRLALIDLDLAPISTLHGLCTHILRDYPFAAGTGFELGELVSDQSLHEELVADLKRQLAQSSDEIGAGDAYWLAEFPKLEKTLRLVTDPAMRVDAPALVPVDWAMDIQRAAELRAFADDNAKVFKLSTSAYRSAMKRLAAFIEQGDLAAEIKLDALLVEDPLQQYFRTEAIAGLRNHPVLDFATRAAAVLTAHGDAVRAEALVRYRRQLLQWRAERLIERGLFTYDALIERVHTALTGDSAALADAVCAGWPVALIDEFQDTNARQYGILDRIYRDEDRQPRGTLVMIGDPKQAIYGFRGGDIHTYAGAVRAATQRMSLRTNHRSSRAFIDGLNSFYALTAPGFGRRDERPEFEYTEVLASRRRDDAPYRIDGVECQQPLVIHYRDEIPDTTPQRVFAALQACAWQIAGMLQSGRHTLGAAKLQPGDIAVLLPTNRHVADLRALLVGSGVPCAGAGRNRVFDSEWARELQVVLYAIAHCDDAPAVRAALSTRLLGWEIADLPVLTVDIERWQIEVQYLHELLLLWQRQGVIVVVQRLIERVAPRLKAAVDYERSITDLRHLGEELQKAGEEQHGPAQLLNWLDTVRREPDAAGEDGDAQELRIETDAARVRLLTLHASKGLEFRMVFLPLMWAHQARRGSAFPIVVDAATGERVVDMGTALIRERLQQAANEDQDERFRVLYVALTRAEYGCHVYALSPARRQDGRTTKAAVDPARSALDALVERVLETLQSDAALFASRAGIEWRDGWPMQSARYRNPPTPAREVIVLPLPQLRAARGVRSFSTLVRFAHSAAVEESAAVDESVRDANGLDAVPDIEQEIVDGASPSAELEALNDSRGAELGNALHAVFENRQSGRPLQAQLPLLQRMFRGQGVRLRPQDGDTLLMRWAARLDAVLDADLGNGLRLVALDDQAQRAEMEFHFAVDRLTLQALRQVCVTHGQAHLIPDRLAPAQINGLLTGKIDLVLQHGGRFHVVDYKSNALGVCVDDYLPAALDRAMAAHDYYFQALIYTLAVDRMLAQRVVGYRRAQHLGDAIYLFLRGAGLAPGVGIWRHRFADDLVADLQHVMASTEAKR
jgi:exodeoxyribonuclease V beta subunit